MVSFFFFKTGVGGTGKIEQEIVRNCVHTFERNIEAIWGNQAQYGHMLVNANMQI